jgi:uncharacterized protein YndB with AHSA1/START domain
MMDTKGEFTTVPCVAFTRTLPGPIEKVWAHLTDTSLLPGWFGEDSKIEPRQGGSVRLLGGHIRGTVTQWHPAHELTYTWNVFGPDDGPDAVSDYPESYPTFVLETSGSEVILTFRHFPVLERFVFQNAMGWHVMLDMLEASLRGEKVEDRSVYAEKNARLYSVDLANLER